MEVKNSNWFSSDINQVRTPSVSLPIDCDCIQKIIDYLSNNYIHNFSSVNSNTNMNCNIILLKRAKKIGFDLTSFDAVKANRHLENLYFERLRKRVEKLYCESSGDAPYIIEYRKDLKVILDKYICYNPENGFDFKGILKKLKYIETADLLYIYSRKFIHLPYFIILKKHFEFDTIDLKNKNLENETIKDFDQQIWHAYNNNSSLEIFLKRGVIINVNSIDSDGIREETLLHLSAQKEDYAFSKYLLENHAEVNCIDFNNRSPLYFAVLSGKIELIKLFLDSGADVNLVDCQGRTPLHYVTTGVAAKLLLENGAKTDILDEDGCSPLRLAKHNARVAKRHTEEEDITHKFADEYAGYKDVIKALKEHENLIKSVATL